MNTNEMVHLSKWLSLILRHKPEQAGLSLDTNGYVLVSDLLAAAQRHGKALDATTLAQLVRDNDKQRFAFSADGRRIRANQGHSRPVELDLKPQTPPTLLYHGTVERNLAAIMREGLRPMRRQHVHLSAEIATARAVGARYGKPIILVVAAGALAAAGQPFYRAENGVWLADAIAPSALSRLE